MKIKTLMVACFLFAPIQLCAADANSALFRGHVLQVRNHYTSGGLFRVEVQLFTQAPSGGPYSPRFFCSPTIWDDCEVSDLITGCTPVCETEPGADDSKVEVCHCTPFNPGAGICLETEPFHDGFGMLAESVTPSSGCSSLP